MEKKSVIFERKFNSFDVFLNNDICDQTWKDFENDEAAYRQQLASRKVEYEKFICKGEYKQWVKVIHLVSSIFCDKEGQFKLKSYSDRPWKPKLVKFCKRVLLSLPRQRNLLKRTLSDTEIVQKQLTYVKESVQNYFSSQDLYQNNQNQEDRHVSKEKLTQLWKENQKKAIEIINNSGNWPKRIITIIDKSKTEVYYQNKYNIDELELKPILNEYPNNDIEVPDITPDEIGGITRKTLAEKKWGKDGVRYEDYKKNPAETSKEVSCIYNVVKRFKKAPRTWKHGLIRRNPKKNYNPDELTTLRHISLLPTIYKIFSKCLCHRIIPKVVGTAVNFWQRAYIKKRDRQELIFLMQTAIDDFKRISSHFRPPLWTLEMPLEV